VNATVEERKVTLPETFRRGRAALKELDAVFDQLEQSCADLEQTYVKVDGMLAEMATSLTAMEEQAVAAIEFGECLNGQRGGQEPSVA
jgi:septation ring formation regulator EzrA